MPDRLKGTYADKWREMLQKNSCSSKRIGNDEEERRFWAEYISKVGGYSPDPYSLRICSTVCSLVEPLKANSILEIGPGWGNYTMRLSALCDSYTCVDISPEVLGYIQKIAGEKGISNISTLCGKWEDTAVLPHDVVFAYNCFYRMEEIERSLKLIDESAKKLAVIGMNESPEQPYLTELENELGLEVCYTRLDASALLKILGEMGINAEMIRIPNVREYVYGDLESLMARAEAYIVPPFDESKVREIVLRYYIQEGGGYRCRYKFCSDLIYWFK